MRLAFCQHINAAGKSLSRSFSSQACVPLEIFYNRPPLTATKKRVKNRVSFVGQNVSMETSRHKFADLAKAKVGLPTPLKIPFSE
jgi:hypothetical protein